MQEQGKRLMLAVALIMGVLFVWQSFFKPKDDDQQKQAQQAQQQVAAQQPAPVTPPVGVGTPSAGPRGPEQMIPLSFGNVVATFSNYGGALVSWKLTDPRYEHDI